VRCVSDFHAAPPADPLSSGIEVAPLALLSWVNIEGPPVRGIAELPMPAARTLEVAVDVLHVQVLNGLAPRGRVMAHPPTELEDGGRVVLLARTLRCALARRILSAPVSRLPWAVPGIGLDRDQ
jgi:hypothetical protein